MNLSCRGRVVLLQLLECRATLFHRRLHGFTSTRVKARSRCTSKWTLRAFSSSPALGGGTSNVPGAGAKDGWSDEVLQLDTGGTAVGATPDGEVFQVVSDAASVGQDLASLGLGCLYTPVGLVQILLDSLQSTTGMPWWCTVAVTTVILRVSLFPLSVKFARNAAKMAKIQPQLAEVMKNVQHYSSIGDKERVEKERIKVADLYTANGCSPFTMMTLPFAQLPFFMSFFIGLRKMALAPVESMRSGGMLWFGDLTVPDPIYALPLIACGLFITNIQLGGEVGETNTLEKKIKRILIAASVLVVPVSVTFPTAVFMYWIPNTLLVTLQMILLRRPAVRTALGIPLIQRKTEKTS